MFSIFLLTGFAHSNEKFNYDEIDFSSRAKRELDKFYQCRNTFDGCMDNEEISMNNLMNSAYTQEEFSKLLKKFDPNLTNQKYFIPLGLNNKELLILAASASLGLVLFPSDEHTMDFVQDHKSVFSKRLVGPTNDYIKPISLGVAAGSYFIGGVMKNNKLVSAGLYTVTAGLASQIVTEAFKVGFGRERPNKDKGAYAFGTEGKSFFSGHSSGAWSIATVFAEVYKDNKYIPYISYGLAALTSYGRLHDKKHYLSDVFYGAIAGHLISKMVMRIHRKSDEAGGFMVSPSYDFKTGTTWIKFKYVQKNIKQKEKWKCTELPEKSRERVRACIYEAYLRSNRGLFN